MDNNALLKKVLILGFSAVFAGLALHVNEKPYPLRFLRGFYLGIAACLMGFLFGGPRARDGLIILFFIFVLVYTVDGVITMARDRKFRKALDKAEPKTEAPPN